MTRRAHELGRPLPDEVRRQRLIDTLADRWVRAVTLVEAPGGFGKTRALAQAIADNAEDPSGIDIYVRCRPGAWRHELLGAAVLEHLGHDAEVGGDVDAVAGRLTTALAGFSPTAVALHLDDLHVLEADGDSVELIAAMIRRLPANAHLVLAGRSVPRLPLARLRAADEVLVVPGDDLLFTPDEIAELAAPHGIDGQVLQPHAGWPALTRLALVAGPDAGGEFLVDEVVAQLGPTDRAALAVGALAGRIDAPTLAAAGVDAEPRELARRLPLVDQLDDGALRVHDLWVESIDILVDPTERAAMATRIAPGLSARGRHDEAIVIAADAGAWDVARAAAMDALAGGDAWLDERSLARWLDRFPAEQHDEPELAYLRAMRARLRSGVGHGDDELQASLDGFATRGLTRFEAAATIESGLRGWLANDLSVILDALGRGERLVAAGEQAPLPFLELGQATMAELQGDFARAHELAAAVDVDALPGTFAELNLRHASTMAFIVGDTTDALRHAEALVARTDSPRNRFICAVAHFQAGDPAPVLAEWESWRGLELGNQRDDFLHALFTAMVDASLGRTPDADRVRSLAWDRSREQCFAALASAARSVIDGTEDAGGAELDATLRALGCDDPLVDGELRRFLPYAYVLSPSARAHLDRPETALSAFHLRRRSLARLVLALRSDRAADWVGYPGPAETVCALPLPWSIEIAAHLADRDPDAGLELAELLLTVAGPPAHELLRRRSTAGDRSATGAGAILAALPRPPDRSTRLDVLDGELRIGHGVGAETPRRSRVRQLLALLVLRPAVRRAEITDLLWPELDAGKARRNLTTTLTHARRALDPDRSGGEASFHLRMRGDRLWLHRSEHLASDAWEVEDLLAEGDALERDGRPDDAATRRADAIDRWIGDPYADLADIDELRAERIDVERKLVRAALDVANWRLAAGLLPEALDAAHRILAADPLEERAHAIVIGAYLVSGDLDLAAAALRDCERILGEEDLTPSPAVTMLARRLDRRLDRIGDDP